jgi:hypothetical protein
MPSAGQNDISRIVPKGIWDSGNPVSPSYFKLNSIVLTNYEGNKPMPDISSIVESFTITEELYSPIVTFTANIKDSVNFFETAKLCGQEKISIKLSKKSSSKDAETEVSLDFYVKEYSNYERSLTTPNTQLYSLIAVAEFAYISELKKISRSIKKNVVDNIKDIFKKDLNIEIDASDKCVTEFTGIITIQSPLRAIEWLRTRSFTVNHSPFFLYYNISAKDKKVLLYPWEKIISEKSSKTFSYKQFSSTIAGTTEAYDEGMKRVLDLKSTIKLDKLSQASKGAFANKLQVIDYATKSFYTNEYKISEDSKISLNDGKKSLKYRVDGSSGSEKTLYDITDVSISTLQVNTAANADYTVNSVSGAVLGNIEGAKLLFGHMQESTQTLIVFGDLNLNPGKKITLKIPSAKKIDASENVSEALDTLLSGDYIITVAAHMFKDGQYSTKLTLVKQNISISSSASDNNPLALQLPTAVNDILP